MVTAVVSTGRSPHRYASLFVGVKNCLMRASNGVGADCANAGIFQLDATHSPVWLLALMSKTFANGLVGDALAA